MAAEKPVNTRSFYIDNIRIFLTSLVVLHHFAITYGGPGGWFYRESSAEFPAIIPLSMFVATNQAFFMGMFFFISAYFTVPSLQRKDAGKFIKDRLLRLGIPTLLFFFVLFPLTIFIRNKFIVEEQATLFGYIFKSQVWGFGPMWFVEALLIFTFIYFVMHKVVKKQTIIKSYPGSLSIFLFACFIGIFQFVIRIWLPVGWSMPFTNFQFPHFVQYIFLFMFGLVAYEQNWLERITFAKGKNWFIFVQVLIFIGFPALFIFGGAGSGSLDKFMGGVTWQSFAYAIWEQLVGFGLVVGLLGIFKYRFNSQGHMAKRLSASSYGVYVFHPAVLLALSALFLNFNIPQFWKFIILAPVALTACFAIGYLVKKIPLLKRVF